MNLFRDPKFLLSGAVDQKGMFARGGLTSRWFYRRGGKIVTIVTSGAMDLGVTYPKFEQF